MGCDYCKHVATPYLRGPLICQESLNRCRKCLFCMYHLFITFIFVRGLLTGRHLVVMGSRAVAEHVFHLEKLISAVASNDGESKALCALLQRCVVHVTLQLVGVWRETKCTSITCKVHNVRDPLFESFQDCHFIFTWKFHRTWLLEQNTASEWKQLICTFFSYSKL